MIHSCQRKIRSCLAASFFALLPAAHGGQLNHYQPGLSGSRDFFVPSIPGFYYFQMDFSYLSDEYHDGNGNMLNAFSAARSLDVSRTINGSAGFGFDKSRSSSLSLNFQGSQLDFGALLDSASRVAASLSINAEATARLQADAVVKAHLENLDLRVSVFSPTLIWSTDTKLFGAKVGALMSLPILDMSIDARLKGSVDVATRVNGLLTVNGTAAVSAGTTVAGSLTATGPRGKTLEIKGGSASLTSKRTGSKTITREFEGDLHLHQDFAYRIKDSGTDLGDLYVQPIWLDWSGSHYEIALSDGFYAPTGKYSDGAIDNTSLGFWTNQTRLAAAWYPLDTKATAFTLATTYEVHSNKKAADIRPGSNLTVNWGFSQYLPLNKKQTWLADIGVGGYDIWQVSDDRGRDVTYEAAVHDEVHAFGAQIGLAQVEWNAALTMRWMHEYAARDRFMGDMFVLNVVKKF